MNGRLYLLISKRIINSLVVLLITISFLFFLLRLSPGGPATKFISPGFSALLAEKVRESFSLDGSLISQYLVFVGNLLKLDFGVSYTYKLPVVDVISQYLPFTMLFSLICIIVQLGSSLTLLFFTNKNRNGRLDRAVSRIFMTAYSIPVFIIGVFLLYFFSYKLNLFPYSGIQSIGELNNITEKVFDVLKHLVLPVVTLSVPGTAMFYTYIRENSENIHNKTYILFLRSMGLDEGEIIKKHVIPNAIAPIISIAGIELGLLFSGTVITEIIFGLPGIGRLAMDAIFSRDYPLILGCSFISGLLIIISNLLADYLNYKTDKRLIKEFIS